MVIVGNNKYNITVVLDPVTELSRSYLHCDCGKWRSIIIDTL